MFAGAAKVSGFNENRLEDAVVLNVSRSCAAVARRYMPRCQVR